MTRMQPTLTKATDELAAEIEAATKVETNAMQSRHDDSLIVKTDILDDIQLDDVLNALVSHVAAVSVEFDRQLEIDIEIRHLRDGLRQVVVSNIRWEEFDA